jgi:hypothetical protein
VGRENNTPLTTLVASFTTPLDAELARTLLDQNEIASRLEGDMLAGAALPLQTAFGGVRVMVAADDAERAAQLIREHEKALAGERRRTDTADERVARAYRLALIGWMLLPVIAQLISFVNLLRAPWSALSAKGRRHYVVGITLDLLVLGSALYWVSHELFERTPDITAPEPW